MTVAETGSFNNAAKKLGMAQPPLSKQIKKLEDQLQVQLFYRTKQGVELTEEGEYLLRKANELFHFMDTTETELKTIGREPEGILDIACIESYSIPFLADVTERFHTRYPLVSFNIAISSSRLVKEMVSKADYELGIIRDYEHEYDKYADSFEKMKLFDAAWVAVFPEDHPLAKRKEAGISLLNLLPYDLIIPRNNYAIGQLRTAFASINKPLVYKCQFDAYAIGLEMIKRGLGVGLMPNTLATNPYYSDLKSKRVVELESVQLQSSISIICRKRLTLSRIARLFTDEATAYAREIVNAAM